MCVWGSYTKLTTTGNWLSLEGDEGGDRVTKLSLLFQLGRQARIKKAI